MRRSLLIAIFTAVAMFYTCHGFFPGHTLAPLDLLHDFDAWKPDPTERVRVSNSLLTDVVVQFVAWDRELLRLVEHGTFPWINRWAGEGSPLFANPQTALFSPFTWPRLLLGLDGWVLMAFLKLLAASLCMYWLARELDIEASQAIASAIVFATAGYTIVWLLFPITNTFVLLPALAASALRLMKQPSIRNAALVILAAALCTAGGHPETLLIGVIGIWIFLWLEAEKRPGLGFPALIPPSVGAVLGFLLLAVQITPFMTLLSGGYASILRPSLAHPFRIWAVASQILPGILGSPLRGELDLTAVPMAENFNLRVGGFIGALVLLAIAVAWRDLAPSLRRGLMIGLTALVLSWYPPGVWPLLRHTPVFRILTLEYAASLFVLFGALASGPAIVILASRRRRKLALALIAAGSLATIGGLLPAFPQARSFMTKAARSGIEQLRARGHLGQEGQVYEQRLDEYLSAAARTTIRRAALPGVCWALAGVALALPIRRRSGVVALAGFAELYAFGVGFNPTVSMNDIPAEPEVIRIIKSRDPSRSYLLAAHFEVFPANAGTLYGARDVVSYDAMTTRRQVLALEPAGYDPLLHTIPQRLRQDQSDALAKLGVRWVLSRNDVPGGRRLDGPPAPAVGVYELAAGTASPPPPNWPSPGVVSGMVISLLAFVISIAWLRLFTIPPPAPP